MMDRKPEDRNETANRVFFRNSQHLYCHFSHWICPIPAVSIVLEMIQSPWVAG